MIEILLTAGGDINAKDKFGCTALAHTVKELNDKNEKKVRDIVPYPAIRREPGRTYVTRIINLLLITHGHQVTLN